VSQKWEWPALMYRNPYEPSIHHENGLSRFITTGLCRPEPWNHYRVLFQDLPDSAPDDVLINYIKIKSDEDLHQIFNLEFDRNVVATPLVNIGLIVEQVKKSTRARLQYVNDGNFKDTLNDTAKNLLLDFLEWRKIYGHRPKLYIYTNTPNLITDKSSSWEIVHAGKFTGEKVMETMLYHYVQSSDPAHGKNHVLYHCTNRKIDVGDFLPWMGTTHSSYLGPDWSFALLRPDTYYRSIQIDLSYIH
jgi:hypothetical protein